MSVLARPRQWCVRSPPRLPHDLQVELSPLSACSAGSPGDLGDEEGAYGGSLIMVQQMVEDTEQAAEAEDEERMCSVVLDPLPSALLQSLSAQGHVRMLRPPAAATWPSHEVPPETAYLPVQEHGHHRKKSRKARRESYDSEGRRKKRKRSTSSSSGCEPDTPRVNPIFVWVTQSSESTITQVLCEDYDKRNRIKLTKTPNGWRAIPRTIMQPVVQTEIVEPEAPTEDTLDLSAAGRHRKEEVELDDRNEEELQEKLEENVDPDVIEHENQDVEEDEVDHVVNDTKERELSDVDEVSTLADIEVTASADCEFDEQADVENNLIEDSFDANVDGYVSESNDVAPMTIDTCEVEEEEDEEEQAENISVMDNTQIDDENQLDTLIENNNNNKVQIEDCCGVVKNTDDEIEDAFSLDNVEDDERLHNLSMLDTMSDVDDVVDNAVDADVEMHEDTSPTEEGAEHVEAENFSMADSNKLEDRIEVKKTDDDLDDSSKLNNIDCEISCKLPLDEVKDEKKLLEEPPIAHASSIPVKRETEAVTPATDLTCKRRRRLSGILPCRNVLRLPPLLARTLSHPTPCPASERRSPSPAHRQSACIPPATTPVCGTQTPKPAHQHNKSNVNLLEGLLCQQPLALDTPAKRPATSQESQAKRRKCEDVTLRSLLKPVQDVAPTSRLLELLTTTNVAPPRKPSPVLEVTPVVVTPPVPPRVPSQTNSPPLDALAQLRFVLQEVAVPDPLFVPRSRLAALLASPASEIPRLVRSPPPATSDTLAVSLSRLHALLKRPDSELLAWAARDWAKPPPLQTAPKTVVSKPPVPKPPAKKSHNKEVPSLPWWLPSKAVPPPPTPEILAAFHAMYGPTLMQPHYFAPHYPEMALWQGAQKSQSARPPQEQHRTSKAAAQVTPQPAAKPRIACKSLLDLLAKKPEEAPALNLVRAPAKPERKEHRQPERDSSCPRLWHPLFGSQKCDTWNWRPVSVRGE